MSAWSVVWRVIDTLLGLAIRADEIAERRRARKKFEELVKARAKDQAAERARAPTVVLPRPRPPR